MKTMELGHAGRSTIRKGATCCCTFFDKKDYICCRQNHIMWFFDEDKGSLQTDIHICLGRF